MLSLLDPRPSAPALFPSRPAAAGVALAVLVASGPAWAQDEEPGLTDEEYAARVEAAAAYPMAATFAPLLEEPILKTADVGLQVVNIRTGEEVYAWGADEALVPASTMKVLTAATALRNLGTAWRFRTELLTDGEINEDGVLEGNLYVRGNGDPTLVVEKAWKMLRDLQVEGVVEINGDVLFDDTYFAGPSLIPGWDKPVDVTNGPAYFAPLSALSMNFNTVDLVIAPGPAVGELARVQMGTASDAIAIESTIETVKAGRRPWIRIQREVPKRGPVKFSLEGRIALDDDIHRYYRSVGEPLPFTIGVFKDLLRREGIKVTGKLKAGEVPEDNEDEMKVLVALASQPLSEVLNHTVKYSSNLMAEQVLRAVGAEVYGDPGTTDKGLAAVRSYLTSLGIPEDEYTVVNGSGLTREARLRPAHLNAVLVDMFHDPLLSPEFLTALSVSGVDGTLRRRFDDDEEVARVRGKTGSLNSVYCLSALARAADDETYAFTLLVNGFERSGPIRAFHDAFGSALLGHTGDELAAGATPE